MNRGLGRGTALRTSVSVLVAALTLALAGCGHGASGTSSLPKASDASFQPTKADFGEIRALLDRQAHALTTHNESAFLATVDPSQPALASQQKTLFHNIAALSVTHLSYAMDPTAALVPATIPGNDPVLHPTVVEHLQLAGTFDHPISNQVDETFVKRDGHWLLGSESEPTDREAFDAPQERPWFGVAIVARRVGPLTVLVDQSQAGSLKGLTEAVRSDIAYDAHLLGVKPSYQVLVDATTNGLSYDFSSLSTEEAAAVTFGVTASDPLGEQATALAGTAIKVNPKLVDEVVSDAGILRHELTHYLLRDYSGSSPKWLSEGVATWVQYYPDDFATSVVTADLYDRLVHADHTLPIVGLFNEDPSLNYPISQAAVTWLVSHYGVAKLLDLMKAYRSNYAGANVDALTARLFRQEYGVTEAQVVSGAFRLIAAYQH